MNFQEAVEYLSSLHAFGWRLDLSRMEALCARLEHPERAFKVVHVAGTNGKGSTTAMIAAILAHAGYRTGSYFSPYVFNLRERVMLAEPHDAPRMISEDDFARLMTDLRPHVEAVAEDESLGQPTEFEVKTMLAFLYFREREVEWAVLETGLGGRLDATNVVQPEVCVITNVGLDHTERLGNTIEEIAGEKAGIIKPGAAVVTAATEPALSVIRAAWEKRGAAEWGRVLHDEGVWRGALETDGFVRSYEYPDHPPSGPLYRQANATLATLAASAIHHRGFRVGRDAVRYGLATAWLPGRYERINRNGPYVLLDGAHNPDGARALAESLRWTFGDRRKILVVGMMGRHSIEGVMDALATVATDIIATQPSDARAMPVARVVEEAAKHGFDAPTITPPMEALRRAILMATRQDVVVVTGSFYTVGEIDVDEAENLPSAEGPPPGMA